MRGENPAFMVFPILFGVLWLGLVAWGITFTVLVLQKLDRIIQLLHGEGKQTRVP